VVGSGAWEGAAGWGRAEAADGDWAAAEGWGWAAAAGSGWAAAGTRATLNQGHRTVAMVAAGVDWVGEVGGWGWAEVGGSDWAEAEGRD